MSQAIPDLTIDYSEREQKKQRFAKILQWVN